MFYGRFCGRRKRMLNQVLNILLRACGCARVWFVQKRPGKVKIPAGWSGKYLWKDGILYRMTRKKIRKYSPRKGKNVRSDGKFIPENVDFSFGKPREKYENDENGEKNFFPRSGKNIKISPMARKKMSETGQWKAKKADFSFEKIQKKRKKYRNGQKNFSPCTEKRQEKLFRRSEKISENG